MKPEKRSVVAGVHYKENGFTLIEVLIAVVILAIGLLGVAGLQVVSLQQTNNAHLRTMANLQAQDAAELLRLNGGSGLSTGEMTALNNRLKERMADDSATIAVNVQGTMATITLSWSESVPVSQDRSGRASQSMVVEARVGPRP